MISTSSDWSAILALQRATHVTLHLLATELADLGLTPSELNALANLADGRNRTVSELGADTGSRPTTVTSVLDRLERRGLVRRGARPGDRRVVLVELTPSGEEVAERALRAVRTLERRALADLTPETAEGLRLGLQALIQVRP